MRTSWSTFMNRASSRRRPPFSTAASPFAPRSSITEPSRVTLTPWSRARSRLATSTARTAQHRNETMIADALARRFSSDQEPAVPIGLASLAGWAFDGSDLAPIGNRLIERVLANAQDAAALMDLSTILQLVGDRDAGLAWQAQALAVQRLFRRPPALAAPDGVRLLAFLAPGDFMANTPLEFLLEGSDVTLNMHYVVPGS